MTDERIAELARDLAASGTCFQPTVHAADIASTGGPGSISTLWCPPALVASGFTVPKLGVPGRPSGGIDSLAQISGYRICLTPREAKRVLNSCGYAHVLAGSEFAPDDAKFFAYRKANGAQNLPPLAIASLLAKKLAMGVTRVGLEVRVAPHGNFGRSRTVASKNAARFCRVASLLDLKATCFLTDGTIPQQPYLGRGEMILALSLLLNRAAPQWLESHANACSEWVSAVSSDHAPERRKIERELAANLLAQGGGLDRLHQLAQRIATEHKHLIVAEQGGRIEYDLGRLRDAILAARMSEGATEFDDSVGVILLEKPGTLVQRGQAILTVRCPEEKWPALKHSLTASFSTRYRKGASDNRPIFGALEIISV